MADDMHGYAVIVEAATCGFFDGLGSLNEIKIKDGKACT